MPTRYKSVSLDDILTDILEYADWTVKHDGRMIIRRDQPVKRSWWLRIITLNPRDVGWKTHYIPRVDVRVHAHSRTLRAHPTVAKKIEYAQADLMRTPPRLPLQAIQAAQRRGSK